MFITSYLSQIIFVAVNIFEFHNCFFVSLLLTNALSSVESRVINFQNLYCVGTNFIKFYVQIANHMRCGKTNRYQHIFTK